MSDLRRSPYLHACLEPHPRSYQDGWVQLIDLLTRLREMFPDLTGWRVHISMEDGPQGAGRDLFHDLHAISGLAM